MIQYDSICTVINYFIYIIDFNQLVLSLFQSMAAGSSRKPGRLTSVFLQVKQKWMEIFSGHSNLDRKSVSVLSWNNTYGMPLCIPTRPGSRIFQKLTAQSRPLSASSGPWLALGSSPGPSFTSSEYFRHLIIAGKGRDPQNLSKVRARQQGISNLNTFWAHLRPAAGCRPENWIELNQEKGLQLWKHRLIPMTSITRTSRVKLKTMCMLRTELHKFARILMRWTTLCYNTTLHPWIHDTSG